MVFKSLSPFVDYAINKEYIAKVLCINQEKPELACHGKCHLKKELKKEQESQKKNNQNNVEEMPFCLFSASFLNLKTAFFIEKQVNSHYLSSFSIFCVEFSTPPPKFS